MLITLAIILLSCAILTPPSIDSKTAAQLNAGAILVEIWWDKEECSDIDLWGQPPKGLSTGYSRKNTPGLSLLRDDTGCGDEDTTGHEIMVGNRIIEGEYVFNVMWYADHLHRGPNKIRYRIAVSPPDGEPHDLLTGEVTLEHERQEITFARITLDKFGVGSDFNTLPKHLYFRSYDTPPEEQTNQVMPR